MVIRASGWISRYDHHSLVGDTVASFIRQLIWNLNEDKMPLFGKPDVKKMEAKGDVKSLIKALRYQPDVQIRLQAIQALGALGDVRAVKPLFTVQNDDDRTVRWGVADALVKIASRSIEPFIAAIHDSSRDVRFRAAACLGSTGDRRAVEPLCTLLKDSDSLVRGTAAWALGKISDSSVVEPLRAALMDGDPLVRGSAARAIGDIQDSMVVEELITALSDEARNVRASVAEALGKSGDPRAVEPLISLLQVDEYLKHTAAEALGKLGDRHAVIPLIAALEENSGRVRKSAARALVALYQGEGMDEQGKQKILAVRQAIQTPHNDSVHCWSDGHTTHTDNGIGVDFPL